MTTQSALSIADLGKFGQKEIEKFLSGHDFIAELEDWALEAARRRIYFSSLLEWNKPRLKKVFHPSGLDNECDFKLWLDLHGGPYISKTSKHLQGVFDTGTAMQGQLEYYIATHAKENKYHFLPEVGFKPRYINDSEGTKVTGRKEKWVHSDITDALQMAGHCDGLCTRTIKVGSKKIKLKMIYEIKTISSTGFRKLIKPHGSYVKQTHAYMVCLDAPVTIIFYINKDNSSKAAFPIVYSQEFWQPMEQRLLRIKKIHDRHEEPNKMVGGHCWQCGYLEACSPRAPARNSGHSRMIGAPEF